MASRHPLRNPWALWFCPNINGEVAKKYNNSYEDATAKETKKIDTFNTVEEMWGVIQAMPNTTRLNLNDTVMYFRDTVTPFWEDPVFKTGGRFIFKLDIAQSADEFVVHLLLHILGEKITQTTAPGVCHGIRITKKDQKRDQFVRVEVWCSTVQHKATLWDYFNTMGKQCGINNFNVNQNMDFKPF